MFPTLVPELEDASGIHLHYEQTGALHTVRSPKRIPKLQKRKENSLVVGSTKDEAGFDASVTEEGVSWLRDSATRLVPILR
jgi:hypothetical protein